MMIFILILCVISATKFQEDCKQDFANYCYVNTKSNNLTYEQLDTVSGHTEFDFMLRIKFIDEDLLIMKFHYERENNFDKVVWRHGKNQMFGCARIGTEVELIGEPDLLKQHNVEMFEKQSIFEKTNVICAFTMRNLERLDSYFVTTGATRRHSSIRFYNNSKERKRFALGPDEPWSSFPQRARSDSYERRRHYCTASYHQDLQALDFYHVLPVTGRERRVIDCSNYGPLNYSMKYVPISYKHEMNRTKVEIDREIKPMKHLLCTSSINLWQLVREDMSFEFIHRNEYNFFCAVEMNRACTNKSFVCTSKEECPEFNIGTKNHAASLNCKDNKWLIDSKYHQDLIPTCEQSFINTPDFFVRIDGKKKKLTSGQCYTNYDCRIKSKLVYTECEDFDKCGNLKFEDNRLSCENNDKFKPRVFVYNSTKVISEYDYFTCDKDTGVWNDGEGTNISDRSQVICLAREGYADMMNAIFPNVFVGSGILMIGIMLGCIIHVRKAVKSAITSVQ